MAVSEQRAGVNLVSMHKTFVVQVAAYLLKEAEGRATSLSASKMLFNLWFLLYSRGCYCQTYRRNKVPPDIMLVELIYIEREAHMAGQEMPDYARQKQTEKSVEFRKGYCSTTQYSDTKKPLYTNTTQALTEIAADTQICGNPAAHGIIRGFAGAMCEPTVPALPTPGIERSNKTIVCPTSSHSEWPMMYLTLCNLTVDSGGGAS